MPLPLHFDLADLAVLILPLAVLFNLLAGGLNVALTPRLRQTTKRLVNLYDTTLVEMEEQRARAECLVTGHHWRIDTKELQNPEDKEMTVMVRCECESCHTRLDFEVRFGLHQIGPNKVGAWANILPTRPPG